MTQEERLNALLDFFIHERPDAQKEIPAALQQKQLLLRGLLNVRPARPVPQDILVLQDEYLQNRQKRSGIVDLDDLRPVQSGGKVYLWQGDITRLAVEAIVNAANSALLGCFVPCHGCIDNAIHSAAGVQLRLACAGIMAKQGAPEPTGTAKITPGFNLPATHVLHTVGPIIQGVVTQRDCAQLADCYTACLSLAAQHKLKSIAFCCISTGEFRFPQKRAAEIAVQTVQGFQKRRGSEIKVVFNVFKDADYGIYEKLLA